MKWLGLEAVFVWHVRRLTRCCNRINRFGSVQIKHVDTPVQPSAGKNQETIDYRNVSVEVSLVHKIVKWVRKAVADPGFPSSNGGGANLLFGHFFPENCIKTKRIGPGVPPMKRKSNCKKFNFESCIIWCAFGILFSMLLMNRECRI